jgi:hypothetical protein
VSDFENYRSEFKLLILAFESYSSIGVSDNSYKYFIINIQFENVSLGLHYTVYLIRM